MQSHEYANLFPLMPENELKELAESIKENGLLHPIAVFQEKILDGRNRHKACLLAGVEPIYIQYTGGEPLKYVLAENLARRHLSETQRAVVAAGLANMENGGWRGNQWQSANLPTAKITQAEAAAMLNVSERTLRTVKAVERAAPELLERMESGELTANEAQKAVKMIVRELQTRQAVRTETSVDEVPEYEVRRGDVWKLGMHRVMCGDAYADIERFTKGMAGALITDPPYGISYTPDWEKWNGTQSDFTKIIGDDEPFNPAQFLGYDVVCFFGAQYFSDLLPIGGWICWDKRTDESRDEMWGAPFELAWYKTRHTAKRSMMIRALHGGVVNADSEKGNNEKRFHPTQKPVIVMLRILELLVKNEIVLDPFAGSGSTLLACELRGLPCYAMEMDENYASVILRRWAKKTGMQPTLLERA
jgi:DNA modification methylase